MIPGSRYRELTASNLRQSARLKRIHPEPIWTSTRRRPPSPASSTATGC